MVIGSIIIIRFHRGHLNQRARDFKYSQVKLNVMGCKPFIFFSFVFILTWTLNVRPSFAQTPEPPKEENAFKDNYLSVELVRNQPFSSSQNQFIGGDISQFFSFRHTLRDQWLMGVNVGFKRFKTKLEKRHVSLFTVSQESLRLIRLYHPLYLAIGPKLFYLLPTRGKKLPPEKETEYNREIGIGFAASLQYIFYKRFLLHARLELWRGVNREVFQGTETSLGLSYSLP